jgi:hypothetical protein
MMHEHGQGRLFIEAASLPFGSSATKMDNFIPRPSEAPNTPDGYRT